MGRGGTGAGETSFRLLDLFAFRFAHNLAHFALQIVKFLRRMAIIQSELANYAFFFCFFDPSIIHQGNARAHT